MQILGEAAARLSPAVREAHPEVPWRQLAGMRNVIIHACFQLDWNAVFLAAVRDVPPLQAHLEAIRTGLPS